MQTSLYPVIRVYSEIHQSSNTQDLICHGKFWTGVFDAYSILCVGVLVFESTGVF